ncbi:MAG: rhomboid family intramembrane serine protease [Smithellaceae bacterium]|nr:rhomboid family intramembrane serine protease [Smithellaceae bacterium]
MNGNSRKSLLCPRCRKLISGDEAICPYCGLAKPASRKLLKLANFFSTGRVDMVDLILYLNAGFYVLSLLLAPSSLSLSMNPFNLLSPSNESLFRLGASGVIPIGGYDRWWTLISASFLHGSLLHIIFNMIALRQLGPFVQREYGASRFLLIYILTGIAGFLLSFLAGVAFTIGASAGICGLIGAIIYYGKSRGDFYGHLIYRQAMGWVAGLVIIGIIVPAINNWAHGGGIISGIALAWLLGYQENAGRRLGYLIATWACVFTTGAVLLWSVVQAVFIYI